MFGTPLTCVSIGAATDCSIVLASAPGNVADTTMVGGVICGKRATGSSTNEIEPASVMTIASAVAKTGRSIKKRSLSAGATGGRHADRRPGLELLDAIGDHDVTGRQTVLHDPVRSDACTQHDVARLRLAAAVDDPNETLVLQLLNGAQRNEQGVERESRSR